MKASASHNEAKPQADAFPLPALRPPPSPFPLPPSPFRPPPSPPCYAPFHRCETKPPGADVQVVAAGVGKIRAGFFDNAQPWSIFPLAPVWEPRWRPRLMEHPRYASRHHG